MKIICLSELLPTVICVLRRRFDIPVSEIMTKQPLVTVPIGTTLDEAKVKLAKTPHRETARR